MARSLKALDGRIVSIVLAAIIIAGGGVLRSIHYFHDRNLWLDEAALAFNVASRSFAGLLEPLELNQAAPLGFLYLLKATTIVFGNADLVWRLPPFLASLAALPLFFLLVRSVLGARAALFALLILAVSPTAVEYAGETKQYAFDLLASILVLMAADFYLKSGRDRARLIALAAAGSLTLFFSHAVVFVTASAGVALLAREALRRRWTELARLAVPGAIVLCAFAVHYVLNLREVAGNPYFADFWEGSLTPASPLSGEGLEEIGEEWVEMFELPLGLHTYRLGATVFLGGLVSLALRGRAFWSAAIMLPPALATVAAALDRYPFTDRFLLFAVPLLTFGVAAGIEGLIVIRKGRLYIAGWILAWLILGETARHLHEERDFLSPRKERNIEPVLARMREHLEPGDAIYVTGLTHPVYRFYTECRPGYEELLNHTTVFGPHQWKYQATPAERFEKLGDAPRVWAIFQHYGEKQKTMVNFIEQRGTLVEVYWGRQTRAYLFDLKR